MWYNIYIYELGGAFMSSDPYGNNMTYSMLRRAIYVLPFFSLNA